MVRRPQDEDDKVAMLHRVPFNLQSHMMQYIKLKKTKKQNCCSRDYAAPQPTLLLLHTFPVRLLLASVRMKNPTRNKLLEVQCNEMWQYYCRKHVPETHFK